MKGACKLELERQNKLRKNMLYSGRKQSEALECPSTKAITVLKGNLTLNNLIP